VNIKNGGILLMKRLLCLITTSILFLNVFSGVAFAEEKKLKLAENASSAILIERDTGQVLFEKNSNEKLPPASMTKVMTMILIMEAIESGKIKLTDEVQVSEFAASMGGSQIFLEPGEAMTVNDLLKGIAIGSANDASVAMAEYIAGTHDSFVDMMNDKVKELGLTNTHFVNTTGLPAENHYTTANDMAIMAKELLKHESITKYTGLYEDYLREDTEDRFWLVNTNRLVKFYNGVDGLKTGYTSEAKYCLTATAKRNDMRVIAVVMGAPTSKERNRQVTQMLDYAFANYATKKLYDRHQFINDVKVSKGSKANAKLVTSETISLLTKKGDAKMDVSTEIIVDKLHAPIQKGEPVGQLVVKNNGKVVTKSPLLASEDIPKASWWKLMKRTIGDFSHTP
jgi:serine-type D-Ala-D-Ala carboxypeptidase (penicillin-binding protein 5/6)